MVVVVLVVVVALVVVAAVVFSQKVRRIVVLALLVVVVVEGVGDFSMCLLLVNGVLMVAWSLVLVLLVLVPLARVWVQLWVVAGVWVL